MRAVGVDAIHRRQVRLVEHRDLHFVLQPDPVAVRVDVGVAGDGDCPDGALRLGNDELRLIRRRRRRLRCGAAHGRVACACERLRRSGQGQQKKDRHVLLHFTPPYSDIRVTGMPSWRAFL